MGCLVATRLPDCSKEFYLLSTHKQLGGLCHSETLNLSLFLEESLKFLSGHRPTNLGTTCVTMDYLEELKRKQGQE